MKLLKTAIIIVIIVLIGGLIYETVLSYTSNRRADALISTLRTNNKHIADRLVDAQNRVTNLEGTVTDLKQGSAELRKQLEASAGLAADLSAENRRLGDALSASESSAGSISATSRELGEAIDRAWDIIERYKITTETE